MYLSKTLSIDTQMTIAIKLYSVVDEIVNFMWAMVLRFFIKNYLDISLKVV